MGTSRGGSLLQATKASSSSPTSRRGQKAEDHEDFEDNDESEYESDEDNHDHDWVDGRDLVAVVVRFRPELLKTLTRYAHHSFSSVFYPQS